MSRMSVMTGAENLWFSGIEYRPLSTCSLDSPLEARLEEGYPVQQAPQSLPGGSRGREPWREANEPRQRSPMREHADWVHASKSFRSVQYGKRIPQAAAARCLCERKRQCFPDVHLLAQHLFLV